MRNVLLIVLALFSTQLIGQIRIHYTQWQQEAQYDVFLVKKPYQADVILCLECASVNGVRIERYKMNADYIVRPVRHKWNGAIKIFITNNPHISMNYKQLHNFQIFFQKKI